MIEPTSKFLNGLMRPMRKCGIVFLCWWMLTLLPAAAGAGASADVRQATAPGETAEMHLPADEILTLWGYDPTHFDMRGDAPEDQAADSGSEDASDVGPASEKNGPAASGPRDGHRIKVCRNETVCILRYKEGHLHRVRVRHLIAPLHYTDALAGVPEPFLQQVRLSLDNLRDQQNVVVRFIAHTDDLPLTERDAHIYGDHHGLSQAVAHRVALAVREYSVLPGIVFEGEGRGAAQPAAPNTTQQGRALNRRVEVEIKRDGQSGGNGDDQMFCGDQLF